MKETDHLTRISSAIACMRFPLILSIIFYHAYIAVPIPDHSLYYWIIYPFSLWIGETGVPAYFMISGLWMFYSSKSYVEKVKSRVHTLVIPYLIWNTVILLAFVFAFFLGYRLIIYNGKGIADYGIIDYIRAYWDRGDWDGGIGKPIYPPMWFLRNLMLLCLISPIIRIIIEKTGLLLPVITGILWIYTPNMGFNYECISSFCLGAFFPIKNISPIDYLERYKIPALCLFILLGVADYLTHTLISVPCSLQIHRLAIFANIIMIPLIGLWLYNHGLHHRSLSNMAFFIYCVHLPIVTLTRKPALWHPEWSSLTHIALYFVSVALITSVCIAIYIVGKKFFPTMMRLATGNRY